MLADLRDRVRPATVVENAKSGLARPLLEITKHGYGGEVSDTTPNNRILHTLRRMGRGETESNDGRTPYPSAPDEMRKAGFYTFYPHAGSLASAEERQEQPASAGFFLLAVSTGASLV